MKYGKSALIEALSGIYFRFWTRKNLRDLIDSLWRDTVIPYQPGRLTDIQSAEVSVTFTRPFLNVPIGLSNLKAYRWVDGYIQDVLFTYPSETWLTNSGFTIIIHETESLTGIIIEYNFIEIIP
jgi:hypothetical protein